MNDLADLRRDYDGGPLRGPALPDDPLELFAGWFSAARDAGVRDPHAMALATVDPDGQPACRMVLMRGCDPRGITLYTNLESRKGRALRAEPRAAVTFWWPQLERQVRAEGRIEPVAGDEADAYFRSRPRGSQLSAWASPQSDELPDRASLDARVAAIEARFAGLDEVARPPFWGGFRLVPRAWEFWQGRPDRTHDRFRYARESTAEWRVVRLAP